MGEKQDLPQTYGIREKTVTDFDSVLFMKRKAKARTEEQMRIVAIEISGGGGMVMNLTEAEVKEVTGATATVMKIVREEETGVTETGTQVHFFSCCLCNFFVFLGIIL
jgi:hypothetical protein